MVAKFIDISRWQRLLFGTSLVAMLWMATPARAVVIFSNPITDANPSSANPFGAGQTVAANMTASGIGRGSGISANAASNRYNATSWSLAANGFDANDYFTWTLTPNSGYEIDYTSLVYTGQASGTGPTTFNFRSSLDNFATNIAAPAAAGATINLSGAAFQNKTTPVEFRLYGYGGSMAAGTYSVNDFTFNGSVDALAVNNDSTITAPASAALGRVMLHETPSSNFNLTKTGNEATTYSASPSSGIAVTADGNIGSGAQSETVGVQLQNVAAGSGSTGAKSYNVVVDNTASSSAGAGQGSADTNDTVNVTATVVANRTVSASTVNLGNVIKGAMTAPATSALTTTGDDNNFTRVTVNGTAATDGSVTVAAGSSQLFNVAASTTNRNVSGVFSSPGDKNGNVILSTTGELLAGESVNPVSVAYTAKAYDASKAAFLANAGTMLTVDLGSFAAGSGLQMTSQAIYNVLQTAGFTAELDFDTISGTGDTSALFTNLTDGVFTSLAAGAANAHNFDISFDTNNLPGTYNATYTLKLSDANAYAGAGAPGSQSLTLNLKGTVAVSAVPESTFTILLVLVVGLPVMAFCRRSLA